MCDSCQFDLFSNIPLSAFEPSFDCCSCSQSWKNGAYLHCFGSRVYPEDIKLAFCKRNKLDDRFCYVVP
jgi:hypothetical protein